MNNPWAFAAAMLLLAAGLAAIAISCEVQACDRVCRANDHTGNYEVFAGGCYCRDDKGLYNPRDSRDAR